MDKSKRENHLKKKPSKKTQKKTSPALLIPKWAKVFLLGFTLGLSVHFIPKIHGFSQKAEFCDLRARSAGTTISNKNPNLPSTYPIVEREGYILAYDGRAKTALWVYEELVPESLAGDAERRNCSFCQDPDIPRIIQANLSDYKGSGFDKGHLVPAADHRSSEKAMRETFYLSNISPQEPKFNRGYWKKLEKHVRDLTNQYGKLRVVSGPLYLPIQDDHGKYHVNYQVIGENNVSVPTHFFKVIVAEGINERKEWAFIIPNKEIDEKTPLEKFQTSIEKIEKVSGILFPRNDE